MNNPDGSPSVKDPDESINGVIDELVQTNERYGKLDPKLREEAIKVAREIMARSDFELLDLATRIQNVAMLTGERGGDRVGREVLTHFDRFHCRLLESGLSEDQADEIALHHLRCLVAYAQSRLTMAKKMGYDRFVAIAERDEEFRTVTEFCMRAVRNCIGLNEAVTGEKCE